MIPIREQLSCAQRELAIRRNVYPSWVKRKRMTYKEAAQQTEHMEAVVNTLKKVEEIDVFLRHTLAGEDLLASQSSQLADMVCELVGLEINLKGDHE